MSEEEKYDHFEKLFAVCKVYYAEFENYAGGNLHIVLSDGNTEDGHVRFCIGEAEREKDYLGVAIGFLLLQLTEEDRDEWWERWNAIP